MEKKERNKKFLDEEKVQSVLKSRYSMIIKKKKDKNTTKPLIYIYTWLLTPNDIPTDKYLQKIYAKK